MTSFDKLTGVLAAVGERGAPGRRVADGGVVWNEPVGPRGAVGPTL